MREERRHGLVPTLAERNFIALSGATRNVTPDRVGRDLLEDILHVDTRIFTYVLLLCLTRFCFYTFHSVRTDYVALCVFAFQRICMTFACTIISRILQI